MKQFILVGFVAIMVIIGGCGEDQAIKDDDDGDFVYVEGGQFIMGDTFGDGDGDDNELPVHNVTVDSFYMSKYPVTFDEYDEFCESMEREKPDDKEMGRGNRPVMNVSWYHAVEYCNWLSERDELTPVYTIDKVNKCLDNSGMWDEVKWTVRCDFSADGYRLPTEAEWEYAAKGGTAGSGQYKFAGSNEADEVAWYVTNSDKKLQPVGGKKANELGLYDMSGNVWEWCWDWYGDYDEDAADNPTGADSGAYRVVRGGSWSAAERIVRTTTRFTNAMPYLEGDGIGFRLVRGQTK